MRLVGQLRRLRQRAGDCEPRRGYAAPFATGSLVDRERLRPTRSEGPAGTLDLGGAESTGVDRELEVIDG